MPFQVDVFANHSKIIVIVNLHKKWQKKKKEAIYKQKNELFQTPFGFTNLNYGF